jgi:acyl-homoserine lactone acylase PvdQ
VYIGNSQIDRMNAKTIDAATMEPIRIYRVRVRPAVDAQRTSTSRSPAERTEILWDTWGVPHIFANEESDLFRGLGYAQMTSHAELLLTLYGRSDDGADSDLSCARP